jgi:hypothetical protein
MIPMNEPISYEDWLKGRRARREGGNWWPAKSSGEKAAQTTSDCERSLTGKEGCRFTPTEKL